MRMSWKDEFKELTGLTHTEQGIWWLNGFWKEGAEAYKEEIWTIVHQFLECQLDRPVLYGKNVDVFTEGTSLDEFKSHRILEIMGETLTVLALRKRLSELDIDNDKCMALTEYLLDKYKKSPQAVVDAPQGDLDPAELKAAQDACDNAVAALSFASDEVAAAAAAKVAAAKAVTAAEEAEAEVRAAEAELQASIDEITQLEEEKKAYLDKRQAIMDDPNAGNVKKGKAASEKAQAEGEDPLPLRKAKITQKAALRRVEKARKLAEAATEAAKAAKDAAHQAHIDAEAAEAAAEVALEEANAALERLKEKGGTPLGKIWWMERVLQEKKKFMR